MSKTRWSYLSETITGIVAGVTGSLLTLGIVHWFNLSDHTIDLLTFTESAFGIGMTVIALIFALILVNQVREIDSKFAEKSKELDERVKNGLENMWETIKSQGQGKLSSSIIVPSMTSMGLDSKPIPGITTINEPAKEVESGQ